MHSMVVTRIEATIAAKYPDVPTETRDAIIKATLDEVFDVALEQCLEYRRKGKVTCKGRVR